MSKVETEHCDPSIRTLERIGVAMGLSLAELLGATPAGPRSPTTQRDVVDEVRGSIVPDYRTFAPARDAGGHAPSGTPADAVSRYGVIRASERSSDYWLTDTGRIQRLSPESITSFAVSMNEDDPGLGDPPSVHADRGDAMAFVLEGTYETRLAGKRFILEPGDAVYFAYDIPHSIRVVGMTRGRMLWVDSPPAMFLHGEMPPGRRKPVVLLAPDRPTDESG